jgi:formyl-CoA transferase
LRFFGTDGAELTRTAHTAPPTLGEHDAAVRDWLGQS